MKTKNYIRFQNNEAEWITTKEEKQAYDGWIKLPRIEYKIFKALMEKRFELIPMLDLIIQIKAEDGEDITHTELTQDARGIFIQNSFRVHLSNLRKSIQSTGITIPTKDGKLVLTIPEWKPTTTTGLYIGLQQFDKEVLKKADYIATVDPIQENIDNNKVTIHNITKGDIKIIECGRIQIKEMFGLRTSRTHKLVVEINGRTFKRLFDPKYPVVWQEGEIINLTKEQEEELEAILKAHFMDVFKSDIIEEVELSYDVNKMEDGTTK